MNAGKEMMGKEGREKFGKVVRNRWSKPISVGNGFNESWICGVEEETKMGLRFQVADVKKPLISVRRLVEKGNNVHFGPTKEDNYILNRKSGDKIGLRANGRGSYLMDVSFSGGEKTSITVDSGAEESVCPWEWGEKFRVIESEKPMNFRNASGGMITHWGHRDV